jgi:hypothetical protein
VKPDGTLIMKPTSVPVAWGLGAIAATSTGYVLAVRYDGSKPDQTRICFVTLTTAGVPEQHPWWGARPAQVEDIQLVNVGGKVTAAYRAVSDGDSVLSVDVDPATGSWGKEAEASKVLAKNVDGPFAVRAKKGAIDLVKR